MSLCRNRLAVVMLAALLSQACLWVCPLAGQARPLAVAPVTVRMEGFVGRQPEGTPLEATWQLRVGKQKVDLYVTKLQILTGNLSPSNLTQALQPYRPALTIAARQADQDLILKAPPDQRIAISGMLDFGGGARTLMPSAVEYLAPTAPTPGR